MAEQPLVNIQGLNSFYGRGRERKQVLRHVSLTLAPGEVLGIVGESGSGKSTLAKCSLGVVKDVEGTLEVNAFRPQMVFQDPYGSLNPAKSVGWFLEEPLRVLGVKDKGERRTQAIDMLRQVGLGEEHYARRPSQLSGGQRQRVAIAAALIGGSRLIVLDEPVSANEAADVPVPAADDLTVVSETETVVVTETSGTAEDAATTVAPDAAADTASDAAPAEEVYTVQQGDSLSLIAKKFYKDGRKYHRILKANADVLKGNPNRLRPGMKLRIPAL